MLICLSRATGTEEREKLPKKIITGCFSLCELEIHEKLTQWIWWNSTNNEIRLHLGYASYILSQGNFKLVFSCEGARWLNSRKNSD